MLEETPMRERQFNVRLNDEEAARLEEVSKHYGLNGAALFRMLLKKEHDRLLTRQQGSPTPLHMDVMRALRAIDNPSDADAIIEALSKSQFDQPVRGVKGALNELCRAGYLQRLNGMKYVLEPKAMRLFDWK